MAEVLERRSPCRLKQNDWLIRHGHNITSQGGEDGIIEQIFTLLDAHEHCGKDQRRWCVEFGAWDGKHLSNTWQLLYNQADKWSGVLIEADAARVRQMQDMYSAHSNVTCVHSFITLDGEDRLASVLERAQAELPVDLDLMSIDVDGADYHIWAELEQYSPKVVIIEFNPTIPNNVVYIQARSTNIYRGSSLAALIDLGMKKGYELVCTTTYNAFFVQTCFYELSHIKDNGIDKMHDVPMPTEFFQLYDGTIKLAGCKKLIWKQIPIHERDVQVLPASERSFPFLASNHDAITNATAYYEECLQAKKQDPQYFLQQSVDAVGKYRHEDFRKLLGFAIKSCTETQTRTSTVSAIWNLCEEMYRKEMAQSNYATAVEWLKDLLHFNPTCSPAARAYAMANLGECFLREHNFVEAEFYLQTSIAIEPNHKTTLKSLAKLYTKEGNLALREEFVDRLRQLDLATPTK